MYKKLSFILLFYYSSRISLKNISFVNIDGSLSGYMNMGKNMVSLSTWRIGKGHLNKDGWHFYPAIAIGPSHELVSYPKTLIT